MADPTKYTPSYDFSDYQASSPSTPLPGAQVDIQLQEIKAAVDSTVDAIKDVRRSDGKLKNLIVTPDSLSADTISKFTRLAAGVEIASEAEAEAGESNEKGMSPLRSSDFLKARIFAPTISKATPTITTSQLQDAIDYALQALARDSAGGDAYATREIILPYGQYEIDSTITIHKTGASSSLPDLQSLVIRGEGLSGTVFRAAAGNLRMFDIQNLQVGFSGFLAVGADDGTTEFMKLGDEASFVPVFQSHIRDFKLYGMNKGFTIGHMFDSQFQNGAILGMAGTAPVGIDIKAHATDNSNFINFGRVHIEQAKGATLVRARSSLGATQFHQNLNFSGCHFETRAYDTKILDLQGVINSMWADCVFTRNNTDGNGLTYLDSAPIVTLDSCYGNLFAGGGMNHVGTQYADVPKLVKLDGGTRRPKFDAVYFAPGLLEPSPGVSDIIENNSTDTAGTTIVMRDCQATSFTNLPINTALHVTGKTLGNQHFEFDTSANTGGDDLALLFSNDVGGQTKTQLAKFSRAGVSNLGAIAAPFQQTVANGASAQYTMPNPDSANPSARGAYLVFANSPNAAPVAFVYSSGAALTAMFAGADTAVGTTDPGTASKLNIFLTGSKITVFNRLGSDRIISILPFGLGAT